MYKSAKSSKKSPLGGKETKMPTMNGRKYPALVMASSIEPKDITWLWYPYIPAGSASMIFGPGGTGKSHIAIDIASHITNGVAFPGQNKPLPPQNVLMMSAEDEFDRVLVPRLIKAKADLKKVAFPKVPFTLDKDGLAMLEEYIAGFSAGIVFIDPLVAYIGGKVDINRANETREFTGGLHQMAMRTGVPIIVVHHSRKGSEGADYERMMGSADFNNAVRSVLFTTQAPNGDRIMRHVKANYAPLGPTLGYRFGEEGFEWTGEYQEDGVKATRGRKPTDRSGIAVELREKLSNGPMRAVDIERWAEQKGYTHRTMVRAKAGVAESYLVSVNGKMSWYWRLIESTPDGEQAEVPVMGSEWGATRVDRTEREIIARTEERVSKVVAKVGPRGPRPSPSTSPLSDEELTKWMEGNL